MIYNLSRWNKHWETKQLKELGIFSRGKSKHRPRNDPALFENGIYPMIQTGDVRSSSIFIEKHSQQYNEIGLKQSKLWDTGTLCITIAANIAETSILAYPMCFPDSIVGFTANKKETTECFMHYVFVFIKKSIQSSVIGSIQDNINIEYLTSLKFKIPPLKEQNKITDILLSLDKKISINNSIISKLEEMAKTIYEYWFLQFDFPNAEGKPYASSGGAMKYSEELGREIPKDWEAIEIDKICKIYSGFAFKSTQYVKEGKYRLITIKNVQENGLLLEPANFIDELPKKLPAYCLLEQGDILMSLTGNVGRVGLMFDDMCLLNQRVAKICPSDEEMRGLIYFLFKSTFVKSKMENMAGGTSQENLSPIETGKILIPYNEKIFRSFSKVANQWVSMIVKKQRENQKLAEIRDWLLPMLMSGQARVE